MKVKLGPSLTQASFKVLERIPEMVHGVDFSFLFFWNKICKRRVYELSSVKTTVSFLSDFVAVTPPLISGGVGIRRI